MNRLDEIARRLEAATPGPWEAGYDGGWTVETKDAVIVDMTDSEAEQGRIDADFIAHAPTDLAALLAAVREVGALVAPQWRSIEYDRNALIDDIRATLAMLTETTEEETDEG